MPTRPCAGPTPGQPCPTRQLVPATPGAKTAARCPTCQRTWQQAKDSRRGGHGDWKQRARAVTEHRQQYGDWCPGWQRPPHPVTPPNKLSADHQIPIAQGGPLHPEAYRVLCVVCNSARGARLLSP